MFARLSLALTALAGSCTTTPPQPLQSANMPTTGLNIASWNLEFLAAQDGAGCQPRTAADYQAMRAIADGLDVDVIAFQEAKNPQAAARASTPANTRL